MKPCEGGIEIKLSELDFDADGKIAACEGSLSKYAAALEREVSLVLAK